MYTRQELTEYTRDELRQIVRDNNINCVPTKLSKEQLIEVILSCDSGNLKCPEKSGPYVKLPDEFGGKVGCKKANKIHIDFDHKPKKKKVVKDDSSEEKEEKPKKDSPKKKKIDIEDAVKDAILSYSGDIKEINSVKAMKALLSKYGISSDMFDDNQSDILKLAKVYLKQKKEAVKKPKTPSPESEEEEEEEEEESDINEDEVERITKKSVLEFEGKPSDITIKYIKGEISKSGFTEDQIKKIDNSIIKKFIQKYGQQLKENRKKAKQQEKVKTPPSPKKSPPPKPKSPSPKQIEENRLIKMLKERLAKKGITKDLPSDEEELLAIMDAQKCDPEKFVFCDDGFACHVENKICIPDKDFPDNMNRTFMVNGKVVVGNQQIIDKLKGEIVSPPIGPIPVDLLPFQPVQVVQEPVKSPSQSPESVIEEEIIKQPSPKQPSPKQSEQFPKVIGVTTEVVESLEDEDEILRDKRQYEKYSKISKALNECIMQTLLRV